MTTVTRSINLNGRAILQFNAIYLLGAAAAGLIMDISGIFFSTGPQSGLVASAPHAGIGFIEAHGLAFIIGMLMWRAPPLRSWHLAAAAVHILLGTANLVFWQLFVAADVLAVGYVTTTLHGLFAVLQLLAAGAAGVGTRASATA
jgi:hypothetical protein